MKKFLSLIFIALTLKSFAQYESVNYWLNLFAKYRLQNICYGDNRIYAASKNVLSIFDLKNQSVSYLSVTDGLDDFNITDIAFSNFNNTLCVTYKSGNIDIIRQNKIINLPYIAENQSILDKSLNTVLPWKNYFLIAADFGIVRIDLEKLIVSDVCYFPSTQVKDLAVWNNFFFALTPQGLYYISAEGNFSDFSQWKLIPLHNLYSLSANANTLFFTTYQNNLTTVYKYVNDSYQEIFSTEGRFKIFASDNFLLLYSNKLLKISLSGQLLSETQQINGHKFYLTDICQNNSNFYASDLYNGYVFNFNQFYSEPSPFSDSISNFTTYKNQLFICFYPDSIDLQNGYSAVLSYFQDDNWHTFSSSSLNYFTVIAIDPSNPKHWFAGTHGSGLVEFYDGNIVKIYNQTNSPLHSPNNNIIITDLKFDKKNNLWVLYQSTDYPLAVLSPNHTWQIIKESHPAASLKTGKFIINSENMIWANMFQKGVLAINLNNNTSKLFYPSPKVGKAINAITEDQDSILWLGTTDGIAYLSTQDFNSPDFKAIRPKVQVNLNDTTVYGYLLDNVSITDLKTDMANRKWASSLLGGVFLLSSDCMQQLKNFSKHTGTLFTNKVFQIIPDNYNGIIYFIAQPGLIGYKSSLSMPQQNFNNVKISPNPVRPNYNGVIRITGLMSNTLIKITDLEGNVIFETRSNAGTAIWNGLTLDGRRPHSGVYLIFCVNEQANHKCVKKLLIIK